MNANVGDILVLKDKQTIEDQYQKGVLADGQQVIVERVRNIDYTTDLGYARWTLYSFKDSNLLLVSAVCKFNDSDETVTNRVYFRPDAFQPGSRQELLDNGLDWLFNPPSNPECFDIDDLEFSSEIAMDGVPCPRLNTYIGQYETQVYLLTEWEAKLVEGQTANNPYLLALEIGDYTDFYQGCDIRDTEIEIFKR